MKSEHTNSPDAFHSSFFVLPVFAHDQERLSCYLANRDFRLARDARNQGALSADQKDAPQLARQRVRPKKIRTGLGRTEHDAASATARGSH